MEYRVVRHTLSGAKVTLATTEDKKEAYNLCEGYNMEKVGKCYVEFQQEFPQDIKERKDK